MNPKLILALLAIILAGLSYVWPSVIILAAAHLVP